MQGLLLEQHNTRAIFETPLRLLTKADIEMWSYTLIMFVALTVALFEMFSDIIYI